MASNYSDQNKILPRENTTSKYEEDRASVDNMLNEYLDGSDLTMKLNEYFSNSSCFTPVSYEEQQLDENINQIIPSISPLKVNTNISLQTETYQRSTTNILQSFVKDTTDAVQAAKPECLIPVVDEIDKQINMYDTPNGKNNFGDCRKNSSANSDNIQILQKMESVSKAANSPAYNTHLHCNSENPAKITVKTDMTPFDHPITVIKKSFILPTTSPRKKSMSLLTPEKINSVRTKSTVSPSKSLTNSLSKSSTVIPSGTMSLALTLSPSKTSTVSPSRTLSVSPLRTSFKDSRALTVSASKAMTFSSSRALVFSPSRVSTVTSSKESMVSSSVNPSSTSIVSSSNSTIINSSKTLISGSSKVSSFDTSKALTATPSRSSTPSPPRASAVTPLKKSHVLNISSDEMTLNNLQLITNPDKKSPEIDLYLEITSPTTECEHATNEKNRLQHISNSQISELLTETPRNSINNAVTNIVIEFNKSPKRVNVPFRLIQPHVKISRTDVPKSCSLSKMPPFVKISQNQLSANGTNTKKQLQIQPRKYIPTILLRTNRNQHKDNLSLLEKKSSVSTVDKNGKTNYTVVKEPKFSKLSSTDLNPESEIINNMLPTKTTPNIISTRTPSVTTNNVNSFTVPTSTNPASSVIKELNFENPVIVNNSECSSGSLFFISNQSKELITEPIIPLKTTAPEVIHNFIASNDSATTVTSDLQYASSDILNTSVNSDNITTSSPATDLIVTTSDSSYLSVNSQATTKTTNSAVMQNTSNLQEEVSKSSSIHKIDESEKSLKKTNVISKQDPFQNLFKMSANTKDVYMNVLKSNSPLPEKSNCTTKNIHIDANVISEVTKNNDESVYDTFKNINSAEKGYEIRRGRGRSRGRRPSGTVVGTTKMKSIKSESDFSDILFTDGHFVQTQNNRACNHGRGRGRGTRIRGRKAKFLNSRTDVCTRTENENINVKEIHNDLQNNEVPRKKRKYTRRNKDQTSVSNIELLTAVHQIEMENYKSKETEDETNPSIQKFQQNIFSTDGSDNACQYFMHQNQEVVSNIHNNEHKIYYGFPTNWQQNTELFDEKCGLNFENTIDNTVQQISHNETNSTTLDGSQNKQDGSIYNNYNTELINYDNLEASVDASNLESASYISDHQERTVCVKPETNSYILPITDDYLCPEVIGFLSTNTNNQPRSSENFVNSVLQNDAQNNSNIWNQNHSSINGDYTEDMHQPVIMNLDEQSNYNLSAVITNDESNHMLKFTNSESCQHEYENNFQFYNIQENMEADELHQNKYYMSPCLDFDTKPQTNVNQYSNFPEEFDEVIPSTSHASGTRQYYRQRRSRGRGCPGGRSKPEKPYICPLCGICEQYNALLERHLQVEHGDSFGHYYA